MSGQDLAIPHFLALLVYLNHGLDSVRSGLKGLASRSVRCRAQTLVASRLRTALVGLGFGEVSQSATAVSMVLSGLVSAGLIPMRRALTMVAWAYSGTAVLAVLAAVNMHAATLWLIGLVGLALRNKHLQRAGNMLGAALGIGFMLIGLGHVKTAAAPAQADASYAALSSFLGGSLVLAFVAGAVLRIPIRVRVASW